MGVQNLIRGFEQKIGQGKVAILKAEYAETIRPAYVRRYGRVALPLELFVDEADPHFNGLGGYNWVQVGMGVVNEPMAAVRTFAVAHETGHAVTFIELGRVGAAMNVLDNADSRRWEHIADLIAMRVLQQYLPAAAANIVAHLGVIAQRLGPGGHPAAHPSGQARADLIRRLYYGEPFGHLLAGLATKAIPV